MAWLPSHQELADHPKTRRAARRLDVSIVTMVGHLHFLWWWALDHAPDGDLERFDAEDIAEAARWDGDPEVFLKALVDCGPGGGPGFIDGDGRLNDWSEYGGKYEQRVQAGRKAAAVRWQSDRNAKASGSAKATQSGANAEERREEKKTSGRRSAGTTAPEEFVVGEELRAWARDEGITVNLATQTRRFLDHHRSKGSRFKDWVAAWRNWMRKAQEFADAAKPLSKEWLGVGDGWGA